MLIDVILGINKFTTLLLERITYLLHVEEKGKN